jgi:hypothetical protein
LKAAIHFHSDLSLILFVGIQCPLEGSERRGQERGDRTLALVTAPVIGMVAFGEPAITDAWFGAWTLHAAWSWRAQVLALQLQRHLLRLPATGYCMKYAARGKLAKTRGMKTAQMDV